MGDSGNEERRGQLLTELAFFQESIGVQKASRYQHFPRVPLSPNISSSTANHYVDMASMKFVSQTAMITRQSRSAASGQAKRRQSSIRWTLCYD